MCLSTPARQVLAPFLKAGYELLFYDVSKDLTPIFDERVLDRISVVNLCGYYGFCSYDKEFIRKCSERGHYYCGGYDPLPLLF